MLDIEKIRLDFPILARVTWFSIANPRQAVRELLAATNVNHASWLLVTLGVIVMSVAAGVSKWFGLINETDPNQFTFFQPGSVLAEVLSWTFVEAMIGLINYPASALLTIYLFGFRDKSKLVWAAVATSYGLTIVASPLLEIASYLTATPEFSMADVIVWVPYLAVTLGICSLYLAEAVSIGVLRSFWIILAVCTLVILGIVAVATLLFFAYGMFFGFVRLDGTEFGL